MQKKIKPEWHPENAGSEFTTEVMPGTILKKNQNTKSIKRKSLSIDDYYEGVVNSDLVILSKAITLVESSNQAHQAQAQELLQRIFTKTGNSIRIGITGPPGAGKSTFIEALGLYLTKNNLKVAVLAVDPSSSLSKGSILGDKTRMQMLSNEKNAFIRPSPSSGTLGGVAKKTRETILLCEAAGYDVILIETIGVGQSEITVRSMVDFFMLMLIPGSGDELQGIKKGVVEIADALIINKADGTYKTRAEITKRDYLNALQLLQPATDGWKTQVKTCSALNNIGVDDIWSMINEFIENTKNSGIFEVRRNNQMLHWVNSMLEDAIKEKFFNNPKIKKTLPDVQNMVLQGKTTPSNAVTDLLSIFYNNEI